jgi:sarcosine oxidase, subunit beta
MGHSPTVAVIGAGAIGLCAALELAEAGAGHVAVIERRHVASGSSGLAVGIIETQYVDPLSIEIRVRSMDFFARLERERALPITRNGYLRIAHDDADLEAFAGSVETQRALGVANARVLDRDGIAALVPDLRLDGIAGGLYGPDDGWTDPHHTCALIADAARAAGVEIRLSTELLGCDDAPDGGIRLVTTHGEIACDFVVNAAGAWAERVGNLLGASSPIAPQRHKALFVHLDEPLGYVMPSVMNYVPSSGGYGLYFRDDGPTRLVAGLHTEEPLHDVVDPDRWPRGNDHDYIVEVARQLEHQLPRLADTAHLDGVWAGLYPISPDGKPTVGPYRDRPRVIAALGGGGSGFQSAPALGRLAADWILNGEPHSIPGATALLPR